jgi:hypothetical protein
MKSRTSIRLAASLFVVLVVVGRSYAQDYYESSVLSPSPFMGNNDEIFKLADGSVWQVKYSYEYLYAYNPSVTICPKQGRLVVGKKWLNVQLVSGTQNGASLSKGRVAPTEKWELVEETNLEGSISGTVKPGRIFKTTSGNVYEVTELTLQLVLEVQPKVVVLRNGKIYTLIVKGFDEPLIDSKLN